MPPYVFGSGYDQVASQKNFYDNFFRQVAESNAAREADARDKAMRYQFQQAAADDQAQQANNALVLHQQDTAQREADNQRSDALHRFEFGVQEGDRNRNFTESQKQRGEDVAFRNKQFDASYGEKKSDKDFNLAMQMAVDDPAKLDTLFPNMTPDQKAITLENFKNRNKQENLDYASTAASGAQLNALVDAKRRALQMAPLGADPIKDGWFNSNKTKWDADRAELKGKEAPRLTQEDVDSILAGNKHLGKSLSYLAFDEGSQRFVPIMPKPWQPPVAGGGILPASPVMPPVNVGQPAPPYNFSSRSPAMDPQSAAPSWSPNVPIPDSFSLQPIDGTPQPAAPTPPVASIPAGFSIPPVQLQPDMVRIKSQSGQVGTIPRKNLPAALARGAILLE